MGGLVAISNELSPIPSSIKPMSSSKGKSMIRGRGREKVRVVAKDRRRREVRRIFGGAGNEGLDAPTI